MPERVRRVRLRDIDVERFWQLEQHNDAMLRELTLIAIGAQTGREGSTPKRVLQLVGRTRERFLAQRDSLFRQVRDATAEGAGTVTVELDLPTSAAGAIEEAVEAFELADDYCRAGDLLTLASPPDVAAFRRELSQRILEQLEPAVS